MKKGRQYRSDNQIFLYFLKNDRSNSSKFIFSFSYYATASTSESVLIIGGYTAFQSYTSTIAEYKDGTWKNVGNLMQARYGHGAISDTSGSITMVVGGYPNRGSS